VVLGLCVVLFLLNAAGLAYFQHTYEATLHASPFYPIYLDLRSLALKPYSLFMLAVFVAWGLFRVFRRTPEPLERTTELHRLALLAMVVCSILGLVLLLLFKL
jgi:prolipoprotein diacylglyceryltransferase